MIPKLFQLGPIAVYSYGLMLGIAFIVANVLLTRELRRKKMDVAIATSITFISLIGGIGGSKLFYLLENTDEFSRGAIKAIFSPAGLTFYGGLIVVAISLLIYVKIKRIPFLKLADAIAPALIIAYGIGRIGCLLAGDGDYGTPSKLPWAMTFEHGTAKPAVELREYFQRNPQEDSVWHYSQLSTQIAGRDDFGYITRFDQLTTVHPAPLYETLYSVAIFFFLWMMRRRWEFMTGMLFGVYCMLSGGARFLVEFLRLNPLYASLSMSQWIGLGVVAIGAVIFVQSARRKRERISLTMMTKQDCSLCVEMHAVLDASKDELGFDVNEIFITEGDQYWNEYSDKVPVLLLDGKLIAKYRVTSDELATRLNDYRTHHAAETSAA